jgi:DNA-binding helix-hairpin-helix protein with protein kinase domain
MPTYNHAYGSVNRYYLEIASNAADSQYRTTYLRRAALARRIGENVYNLGSKLDDNGELTTNFSLDSFAVLYRVSLQVVEQQDMPDLEARLKRLIAGFVKHKRG